jgi:hypothetical protein
LKEAAIIIQSSFPTTHDRLVVPPAAVAPPSLLQELPLPTLFFHLEVCGVLVTVLPSQTLSTTRSCTSLVGSVADAVVPLPAELLILLVNVVV